MHRPLQLTLILLTAFPDTYTNTNLTIHCYQYAPDAHILRREPKTGVVAHFEPFMGVLRITLGNRLPGLPSDSPAPRAYLLSVEGLQVHASSSTQVVLHLVSVSTVPTNSIFGLLFGKTKLRPQGRWGPVVELVVNKNIFFFKSPLWECVLLRSTAHTVLTP